MVGSAVVGSTVGSTVDSAVEGSAVDSMIAGSVAGSALAYLLAQGSVTDILMDTTGVLTGTTGLLTDLVILGNTASMSAEVKLRTVRVTRTGIWCASRSKRRS